MFCLWCECELRVLNLLLLLCECYLCFFSSQSAEFFQAHKYTLIFAFLKAVFRFWQDYWLNLSLTKENIVTAALYTFYYWPVCVCVSVWKKEGKIKKAKDWGKDKRTYGNYADLSHRSVLKIPSLLFLSFHRWQCVERFYSSADECLLGRVQCPLNVTVGDLLSQQQ